MTVAELREMLAHARHMVEVRPDDKDKLVAQTFVEIAQPILDEIENKDVTRITFSIK